METNNILEELSDLTGISIRSVQRIENGEVFD